MEERDIHETPAGKTAQSVESQPISAELKARQERVNAIAKDLLSKFPKDGKGKIPPEVGQAVTAAAWAIERGELKKEDIAEITDVAELKARVESGKPVVEKNVSPELYAAQQEVNAIAKEITEALGDTKMTKELNADITSAAWLIQKKKLSREYFLKDLASADDFAKRMADYKVQEEIKHPSHKPSAIDLENQRKVADMAKEIAMELTPEVNGVKKPTPELNQQAMRAAWMVNKGQISREELMKDVKSVEELKAKIDAYKTKAKAQTQETNEPER